MSTGSPLRIDVLAYPGCFASEVFGVPDLLTIASHVARAADGADAPYEISIVSPRRRVTASGGAPITVTPLREADILIVPGFELAPGLDLDATLASLDPEIGAIRAHWQRGAALVTICVGAFLAAEAGVLDGRQATTSWLFADALGRRHPTVNVRAENLTLTDAGVTTTAGFSAMYDLALNMIRQRSGDAVARRTARIALVDDARLTQAPYVDPQLLPTASTAFSASVRRWLDQHLRSSYHLPSLAAQFHVSTRTLLRRFRADTGQTPLEYLQAARVRRACHLLETTDLAISAVSVAVGYRDTGTLTKIFTRHIGRKPTDYRSTFRRRGVPPAPVTLPPEPQPRLTDLGQLVDGVRRTWMDVRLAESGSPFAVGPAIELAGYRLVQEGLTNVVKHAGPHVRIAVAVQWTSDALTVEVSDDGVGRAADLPGIGAGLQGLRERVTAAGGTFDSAPLDPGFRVRARFPRDGAS